MAIKQAIVGIFIKPGDLLDYKIGFQGAKPAEEPTEDVPDYWPKRLTKADIDRLYIEDRRNAPVSREGRS